METTNEKGSFSVEDGDIRYQRCSEVEDQFIHQAFQVGFSDYLVKMDFSMEDFIRRFFGPEGNSREHSFIAFHKDEPVGVILGGIRNYETIKTMRCGALAISPNFRGTGISQRLFELHKEEAIKQGCKQLFLEVIVGNDRAINFYTKLGYEKIYDIVYFSNGDLSQLNQVKVHSEIQVERIDFHNFQHGIEKWNYHINWQNDIDSIAKIPNNAYYAAFEKGNFAGGISIHSGGNISFLMVDKAYRGQGIGTLLLQTASQDLNPTKMSTGFPNNSLLEGFFKKQGFQKGSLTQYEMYLSL
jgi:ribosomal protein S18 acetylase RimI-like enzyme